MKWKEFFRPTFGKILLSVIIAIFPAYKETICPFAPPCFDKWILIFSALSNFLDRYMFGTQGFIGKTQFYNNLIPDFISFLVIYALSILLIYIIACLTFFIANKLKKIKIIEVNNK